MLAATSPERDRFPTLFHLALQIVSARRRLPDPLSHHLTAVIAQAWDIISNPNAISKDTAPEAIQLALRLRESERLRSAMEPARGHMTAEVAERLLAMEREFETSR
jgi:hypothetical protein